MEAFGQALRDRARALGLTLSEVARRAGMSERRFGNYVTGRREPDFATLLRICRVLATTPNDLLGVGEAADICEERATAEERERLWDELLMVARALSDDDLRLVIRQLVAVLEHRRITNFRSGA
ncbi:helix-turn-helix transcriptional regulator [Azospirillum sp.]|uniref:helix-turn-helix domain-containing protein n=1 Tax=Azospirillum sp. TaxID=34012 RepID=UPI002D532BBC|nr:helix-turn-helix transcriptional regulator [Azospirillum sp.]HYD64081.1 helix-turn-helix transcriptional regulator [Azospirillum sp.]